MITAASSGGSYIELAVVSSIWGNGVPVMEPRFSLGGRFVGIYERKPMLIVIHSQAVSMKIPNAQILTPEQATQDVIILDGTNQIVLKGQCAAIVKANYEEFTEPDSNNSVLKITFEIEVLKPVGEPAKSLSSLNS